MSEDEVLAFAAERAATIREAETDLLEIGYHWAVTHPAERLREDEAARPGRERARRYGGEGTPEVTEFAAAELGARLGTTTFAAGQLMADAVDLVHRGRDLWTRVQAGEVKASYARYVVKQTRHLPMDEAQYVATAVAEPADGRIPWTRFEALVEAAVVKANPELAREREERARTASFAKKLRNQSHGNASYLIHTDVATVDQIDQTVDAYADALAEEFPDLSVDERRVLAVRMLLTPGADQDPGKLAEHAPVVNLYVHVTPGEPIARLEGHGPVTTDWITQVLGPRCRFKVYPVIDLAGMAPVDAYEIPDRHRQAVQLMTPADTFPYGSSLSRKQQVDHTEPYDPHGPPGQSGLGNYGPMTTAHHRIKTHGGWEVKQPFAGIYVWRDPHGAHYLVDHTGTRRLPGRSDNLPMVVEIYRDLPEIEWAA
ncbi:hypothetical protein [Nocardioides sp.]|uniref:hypothetical protein n=1 Tax=Nocardioides sp. TaxID=35761 RepID=UPI0025FBD691|nr:hypothetical protein [Nocardioides sp.]